MILQANSNNGSHMAKGLYKGLLPPTSIYVGQHLVYSAYAVMGTTYETQNFSHTSATTDGHTWEAKVLGVAGTDAGGTYYRVGIVWPDMAWWRDTYMSPSDTWDVVSTNMNNSWTNVMSNAAFGGKLRSIDRCIAHSVRDDNGRVTYIPPLNGCGGMIKEVDFAEITTGSLRNFAVNNANLMSIRNFDKLLASGVTGDLREGFSGTGITEFDAGNGQMSGFSQQYGYSFIKGCKSLTAIRIVQQSLVGTNINLSIVSGCESLPTFNWGLWWTSYQTIGTMSFYNCKVLTTCGGLSGIRLAERANLSNAFVNCYVLENPHFETWVGADGVSKPIVNTNNSYWLQYLGRDLAPAEKYDIDVNGWTFVVQDVFDRIELGGILSFAYFSGNILNIGSIKLRRVNTSNTVVNAVITFTNSGITYFSMEHWSDIADVYISSLRDAFSHCTSLVSADFTGLKWYGVYANLPAATTSFASNIFADCPNLISIIADYNLCDIYTDSGVTAIIDFSGATAWVNTTQIESLLNSLAANVATKYSQQGETVRLQFSANTKSVITGLANWSTLSVQIAANGWTII